MCEPHDSTGEPGAGNRPAGFGERGEETCPWESACGPAAKAPDEPPTPYRLRASPRLYSNLVGTPIWALVASIPEKPPPSNAVLRAPLAQTLAAIGVDTEIEMCSAALRHRQAVAQVVGVGLARDRRVWAISSRRFHPKPATERMHRTQRWCQDR